MKNKLSILGPGAQRTIRVLRIIAGLALIGWVVFYPTDAVNFLNARLPERYLSSAPTVLRITLDAKTYDKLKHQQQRITAERKGKTETYEGIPVYALFLDPDGPAYSFVFESGDNIALRYREGGKWCTSECKFSDMLRDKEGQEDLIVKEADGTFTLVSPAFFVLDAGFHRKAVRVDVLRRANADVQTVDFGNILHQRRYLW